MTRPTQRRSTLAVAIVCGLLAGSAALPIAAQTPERTTKKANASPKAKKPVEVSLAFLTEMNVASLAIETNALVDWVRPIITAVESRFASEPAHRMVVLQVTLHPDRAAELAVAGSPAATDAEVKDILRAAGAKVAPRTRIVDCSFQIVARINGGPADPKAPLVPRLENPDERRFGAFRAVPLPEKLARMKRWARTEALPLLGVAASKADARFKGVRDLGRALSGVDPERPLDIAALADHNPAYWRAMLEMVPGDPLLPAIRIALHTANGEIDRARRYSNLMAVFDARKSLSSRLLGEFRAMLGPFYQDVEGRIGEGIALNDKGKLAEAMAVYDGVLKDYPGSAWAHYERSQTAMGTAAKEAKGLDSMFTDWPKTRAAILACDPLYEMMSRSQGAEEIFGLTRRLELKTLFKERSKTVADLVTYADIARDLGDYPFAAMLYWNILSVAKPEDYGRRELIEDFLYCLEQLDVKDLKENFRGDHKAAFERIKADRKKRVEAGPGTDQKAPALKARP